MLSHEHEMPEKSSHQQAAEDRCVPAYESPRLIDLGKATTAIQGGSQGNRYDFGTSGYYSIG